MQSRVPWLVVGMLSLLLSGFAGAQDYSWTEIIIPGEATVSNVFGLNDKGQTAVTNRVRGGSLIKLQAHHNQVRDGGRNIRQKAGQGFPS